MWQDNVMEGNGKPAQIFVLMSEYNDYGGGSTKLYGYTPFEHLAQEWVADMEKRVVAAKEATQSIRLRMDAWTILNPRPPYPNVPDLVKNLLKTPKKERTPEHHQAIMAAKAEMERLREEGYKPLNIWSDAGAVERARIVAEYDTKIIDDMAKLHVDDSFSYEPVERV